MTVELLDEGAPAHVRNLGFELRWSSPGYPGRRSTRRYVRFGGWLAEPDLHYAQARLALEYNGAEHASLARMRKDSVRLLDLQRAGWEVRTYTAVHAFSRLDRW